MFQSEPICILTAGPTIDGRHTDQQVIDDIAETYSPELYTARINEDHWQWGEKLGSVLSVEKRENQLWAVLKPNSRLLDTVERGQLLHTSCEYEPNFAGTGKAYLSGLALTDEPASLGTTQIHLSTKNKTDEDKEKISLSSGATIGIDRLSDKDPNAQEERTLLSRLIRLLSGHQPLSFSKKEDDEEEDPTVTKELEILLAKNTEQNEAVATALNTLATAVEKLSVEKEEVTTDAAEVVTDGVELSVKVDALSTQMSELTNKLSAITDDEGRNLAGEGDKGYWL